MLGVEFGMAEIAGLIIIAFGLHFLGVYRIAFLHRHAGYHHDTLPPGIFGAYVIGVAFAFGWTPLHPARFWRPSSRSPPRARRSAPAWRLLGVYSAGLGVPFILAAFAVRPFIRFMSHFRHHLGRVEKAMGGLLVLTGAFFVLGWFERGAYFLLETFPGLAEFGLNALRARCQCAFS